MLVSRHGAWHRPWLDQPMPKQKRERGPKARVGRDPPLMLDLLLSALGATVWTRRCCLVTVPGTGHGSTSRCRSGMTS
jgi:hypothetical protein